MTTTSRAALRVGFLFSVSIAAGFGRLWWRGQGAFNEAGRAFDGLLVWQQQGHGVYGLVAVLAALLALLLGGCLWVSRGRVG